MMKIVFIPININKKRLTPVPLQLFHVAHKDKKQENKVMKSFSDITVCDLAQIGLVHTFKYIHFDFHKLKFRKSKEHFFCMTYKSNWKSLTDTF